VAEIRFADVSKVFPDGTAAVDGLTLDVRDGEFLILVGPSGSGKSTALRMLAGLEEVTDGELRIGERVVNDVAPRDRDLAMVFQSYALYPHMSVADNMGFALRMAGHKRPSIRDRVGAVARKLGIEELLERRPRALSGGQRQRVALGRAIVRSPSAFLMDEPLSNLDAKLRVEMRAYIARLHGELQATMVYVTHDQVEAMTMGDRVAVMRAGRLEQCDVPRRLYEQPANLFVGSFIGSPAMNVFRGRLSRGPGGAALAVGGRQVPLPDATFDRRPGLDAHVGGEVIVGVRPEDVRLAAPPDDDAAVLELPVLLAESLGSDLLVHCRLDAPPVVTEQMRETADELGTTDPALSSAADGSAACTTLTARLAPDVVVVPDQRLRLVLDPQRLHFFSPADERAIA
jgi:multiple sugar transport system ATP-binding protein